MKTIELFSGTKSFSKVAEELGHETWTLDNNCELEPDACTDIRSVWASSSLVNNDILWASPPCEAFSVARIGRNWNHDHTPKTEKAQEAMDVLEATLNVINYLSPKYWFIENPKR